MFSKSKKVFVNISMCYGRDARVEQLGQVSVWGEKRGRGEKI